MDDASQRAEEFESLSAIYADDINLDEANGICEVSVQQFPASKNYPESLCKLKGL